jgi:hypothetical protein
MGVLWPQRDWKLATEPEKLIATYLEPVSTPALSLHLMQRDLALHLDKSAKANRRRLFISMMLVRIGALLLISEAAAWVVALIART